MSKSAWWCILAAAAFTRPAAADNSKSASWEQAPRRLENGPKARETPVHWAMLVFSADGKSLAGTGERPPEKKSAAEIRLFGKGGSSSPWELVEQWDLETYRSTWVHLVSFLAVHHFALRLTDDGKVLYGHGQTNKFRDKAPKRDRLPTGNKKDVELAVQGQIFYRSAGDDQVLVIDAAPTGIVLGSHLSADGRNLVIAKPDGLQAFVVETKKRASKDPKAAKRKSTNPMVTKTTYREAKARGAMVAAPTTFQTPACFSPDGACFVASEESGGMVVWDVEAKQLRCRTGAPPEGRAAVAAISNGGRRLFVSAAVAHSRIHVYDAGSGEEIGQIGPLDEAVVSMSASADGESLAYCAGGTVYIHDAATRREVALPLAQDEQVSCVAISLDGRLVAGGGLDGAVRLWEATLPRATPIAQKTEPTEAPLVALGPRRVAVTGSKGEAQDMWLVRLTPKMALLRKSPGGKLLKVSAANGKVTKIAADGATWQLDTKSHVYVGPTLALPEQAAIDVAAKPASPDEENLYLLLGARRRLSALVNLSEQPGNNESIGELRRQADLLEGYLKNRPAPGPATAAIYGELAQIVNDLTRSAATRREVLDALNQQAIAVARQTAKENDLRMLSATAGVAMVIMGSLTEKRVVGTQYRSENGHLIAEPIYEEFTALPGLAEAGFQYLLLDAAANRRRQVELKAAEQLGEAETSKTLMAALELRENAIQRVRDGWRAVANREFGVDVEPFEHDDLLRTSSRRAADLQPLLDALTEQIRCDRGRTKRDDPFDLADALFLKSLVSESSDADVENVFKQAREMTALVPLVPPGDVHDSDRATLLALAATLVSRAVSLESGDCGLCETYSQKAAFAVTLLDQALVFQPDDPVGRIGEQRATALAQCGRSDEALEQARQLVAKHPNSSSARYLLARLECSTGDVDAGLDELENAVMKLGLRDLVDVRKRPEFPQNHPRFKALTELKLQIGSQVGPAGNGRVHISNEGLFPLYDVRFRLQYRGKKAGNKVGSNAATMLVVETALLRLAPGESYVLFTDVNPEYQAKTEKNGRKSKYWSGGKLTVSAARQGTEEFEIETPSMGAF